MITLKLKNYPALLKDHWERCWTGWAAFALMLLALNLWDRYYQFNIAFDRSLDVNAAILKRGTLPAKGDLVGFKLYGDHPLAKGRPYMKKVVGVQGDVVTWKGREVFINGEPFGVAKEYSRKGEKLALGFSGVIPAGHVFVVGTHKDSLDSRYALMGLVKHEHFIGKATVYF